jgi:hypothetical protein
VVQADGVTEAGFGIRICELSNHARDPGRPHDGFVCRSGKMKSRKRSRQLARLSFNAAVAAILSPARSSSSLERELVAVAGSGWCDSTSS